jgi:hypothetical protein
MNVNVVLLLLFASTTTTTTTTAVQLQEESCPPPLPVIGAPLRPQHVMVGADDNNERLVLDLQLPPLESGARYLIDFAPLSTLTSLTKCSTHVHYRHNDAAVAHDNKHSSNALLLETDGLWRVEQRECGALGYTVELSLEQLAACGASHTVAKHLQLFEFTLHVLKQVASHALSEPYAHTVRLYFDQHDNRVLLHADATVAVPRLLAAKYGHDGREFHITLLTERLVPYDSVVVEPASSENTFALHSGTMRRHKELGSGSPDAIPRTSQTWVLDSTESVPENKGYFKLLFAGGGNETADAVEMQVSMYNFHDTPSSASTSNGGADSVSVEVSSHSGVEKASHHKLPFAQDDTVCMRIKLRAPSWLELSLREARLCTEDVAERPCSEQRHTVTLVADGRPTEDVASNKNFAVVITRRSVSMVCFRADDFFVDDQAASLIKPEQLFEADVDVVVHKHNGSSASASASDSLTPTHLHLQGVEFSAPRSSALKTRSLTTEGRSFAIHNEAHTVRRLTPTQANVAIAVAFLAFCCVLTCYLVVSTNLCWRRRALTPEEDATTFLNRADVK